MSITEFQIYRMNIVSALKKAGIKENNIFFYKDTIPVSFPSAFVVLESETGILKTSKKYLVKSDTPFCKCKSVNFHFIS